MKTVPVLWAVMVVIVVILLAIGLLDTNTRESHCKALGGVPVQTKYAIHCFKPEAFVEIGK